MHEEARAELGVERNSVAMALNFLNRVNTAAIKRTAERIGRLGLAAKFSAARRGKNSAALNLGRGISCQECEEFSAAIGKWTRAWRGRDSVGLRPPLALGLAIARAARAVETRFRYPGYGW